MAAATHCLPSRSSLYQADTGQHLFPFDNFFETILSDIRKGALPQVICDGLTPEFLALFPFCNPMYDINQEIASFCNSKPTLLSYQRAYITEVSLFVYRQASAQSPLAQEIAQIAKQLSSLSSLDLPQITEKAARIARSLIGLSPSQISSLSQGSVLTHRVHLSTCLHLIGQVLPLKKYLDPSHNARLLELSVLLKITPFTVDYPIALQRIEQITPQMQQLREQVPALLDIDRLLIQASATLPPDVLQIPDFVAQHAEPLYAAAAHCFWELCKNSPLICTFAETQDYLPDIFQKPIDMTVINRLWDRCPLFQGRDFDTWLCSIVHATDPSQLAETTSRLTRLVSESQQLQQSPRDRSVVALAMSWNTTLMQAACKRLVSATLRNNPGLTSFFS